MIDRIQIKGFKSIREMDLELRPLNVLIGANGSGKSNFLSIFGLLRNSHRLYFPRYVDEQGGARRLLHSGLKKLQRIELNLYYGNRIYHNEWKLVPSTDNLLYISDYDPKTFPFIPVIYHIQDITDTSSIKSTNNLYDNDLLHSDGANLAAFLYRLHETKPEYYQIIVKTIRMVAPFFEDFVLRPNPLNEETILLQWQEANKEEVFNASFLSDGTLRFMALTTLLLQPDLPALILIDEPELGLHPQAIRLLAGMLKSAAAKTQVIVSTQSVTLINQFAPEDIIVVDRQDDASTFKRLNAESLAYWLEEYSMGEIWEKNIVGGNPQR